MVRNLKKGSCLPRLIENNKKKLKPAVFNRCGIGPTTKSICRPFTHIPSTSILSQPALRSATTCRSNLNCGAVRWISINSWKSWSHSCTDVDPSFPPTAFAWIANDKVSLASLSLKENRVWDLSPKPVVVRFARPTTELATAVSVPANRRTRNRYRSNI